MKKVCLIIVVLALMLAASCGVKNTENKDGSTAPTLSDGAEAEASLSLSYEEKVSVQFLDPSGYSQINTLLGWGTEYKGISYKFAKFLAEDERNMTVAETSACIELLEEKTGTEVEGYTVYITEGSYTPYINEKDLCLGYENIKTAEFAAAIAQLVYGREVNYGVLYGLGASIADERGYTEAESIEGTSIENALDLCESAPIYLDLNYACFLDDYADESTLEKVKTISKEFYNYIEKTGKTDLLTDYSDAKRRDYLNEFLAANGKSEYSADDLDGIAFYGGGNELRLMWEDENAKFNLYDDYKDYHQNGSLGEDPLNCGYEDLRKHIVNFQAQMKYTREKLKQYNDSPKKLKVNFVKDGATKKGASNSNYNIDQHAVYLSAVFSLKHEYTHSVINSKYGFSHGENSAVIHSLVYYFSRYPVNEQLSYEVQVEQDVCSGLYNIQNNAPKFIDFVNQFREKISHEINLFDLSDYISFYDNCTSVFKLDEVDLINDNSGYAQVSLGNYLVAQYGEEAICEAAFNNTPEQVLGKSWNTIIDEWRDYLSENCILDDFWEE